MRRNARGVTLVEALVVCALLALLAGLVYGLAAPIRERSRQSVCASQLRQIYSALQMYTADHPGPPVHANVGLVNPLSSANLLPYLSNDKSILFCPDSTPAMRDRLFSSYVWTIFALDSTGPPALVNQIENAVRQYGARLPIVDCTAHDEFFYYPREREVAPIFGKAFVIHLTASGSVFSERVHGYRRDFFEHFP